MDIVLFSFLLSRVENASELFFFFNYSLAFFFCKSSFLPLTADQRFLLIVLMMCILLPFDEANFTQYSTPLDFRERCKIKLLNYR